MMPQAREAQSWEDLFTAEEMEAARDTDLPDLLTSLGYHMKILVTSMAPIPMAAMLGKEFGGMGQNYLRSLFALGFQGFLIMICVAIYAVLVQGIATSGDIISAIWTCMGYTVLLCFTLFKTGSLTKSLFSAH